MVQQVARCQVAQVDLAQMACAVIMRGSSGRSLHRPPYVKLMWNHSPYMIRRRTVNEP